MYFLGIDVSTTATKALLIDPAGAVIAAAASEYNFETPHPLWSEQSPGLWWDGTQKSIRSLLQQARVDPSKIAALGLTGQMHGLVLLDQREKSCARVSCGTTSAPRISAMKSTAW